MQTDIKSKKRGSLGHTRMALAYSIRGFVGKKFTKPAHECYLQAPPLAARAINAPLTGR